MSPLAGASGDLLRDVLQISKRIAIAIDSDGGESLIIALHLPVGAKHERIARSELLIQSQRTRSHVRVIGLDRSAVVAKFCIEVAAGKDASVTHLMADIQL